MAFRLGLEIQTSKFSSAPMKNACCVRVLNRHRATKQRWSRRIAEGAGCPREQVARLRPGDGTGSFGQATHSKMARYRANAPRMGPIFDLDSYLRSMERWFRRLALRGERFTERAGALLKRSEVVATKLHRVEMCATHGRYNHSRLILAQSRSVMLDRDRFGLADPSRDVARFVLALCRLAVRCLGSFRAWDPAIEGFLKMYLCQGRPEALANLQFLGAVCLQLAESDDNLREETLGEGLRIIFEQVVYVRMQMRFRHSQSPWPVG